MAFGDKVGAGWTANNSSVDTTVTVPITGAVEGNLLTVRVTVFDGGSAFGTPAGWTKSGEAYDATAGWGTCRFTKIAEAESVGDENEVTITWTDNGYSTASCLQYEGPFASANPIDLETDETNMNGSGTSVGGVTCTPTADSSLILSDCTVEWRMDWATANTDTGNRITVDAGFTRDVAYGWQNTRPINCMASKVITTIADQTPTWTTDHTGGEAYSDVAAFSAASDSFEITDVDGDEIISNGQQSVVITLSGTVDSAGKRVFIRQGDELNEQEVISETDTTVTVDITYGNAGAGLADIVVWSP